MRAVVCTAWGGPAQLALRDIADPIAATDEVVIDVAACSVNFADLLLIGGTYQTKPALPFVPGLEAAGRIARAPAGAGFAVGDRVVALLWHGGFAERAVAAAAETFALPATLSFATAAVLISAFTSAELALCQVGRLVAGERLIVLGASGGVGLAAVQIGKALGAHVIGVVSRHDRAPLVADAGADRVIRRDRDPWPAALHAAAGPDGAAVCLDPIGGASFDAALSALAWGGRYVIVGFAAGEVPQIPAHRLLVKHRAALGCSLRYFRRFAPAALRTSVAQLFAWHAQGTISPLIGARYPLAATADALRALAAREVAGKIVIDVRNPDTEPAP